MFQLTQITVPGVLNVQYVWKKGVVKNGDRLPFHF
jgi:hypothetical protein